MKYFFVLLLLLTKTTLGNAADSVTPDDFSQLRQMLGKLIPNATPDSINPAPVTGLFEVVYDTQIFYATKDGQYMFRGDLIDAHAHSNVTEARRTIVRLNAINKVSEDKMIIFRPAKVKHTITVFTDIDCGYCRKFHSEIDTYLKEGIEVRYMSYPRSGVDTPSYAKAVSVWCAKDRKAAMTRAQKDEPVEQQTCDNPVRMQMNLGDKVGVEGTPTIITDTGRILPGYVAAERLGEMLADDSRKD